MEKQVAKLVARVEEVSRKITEGEIVLPDPGEGAVWVLVDSGSSIIVAGHRLHFPGARLEPTKTGNSTFQAANGQTFGNDGQFHIPFRTENGHTRSTDFLNARVSMPILPVKTWNSLGNTTIFEEDHGMFIHKDTGEKYMFVANDGVYFVKIFIRDDLIKPKDQPFGRPG